MHDLHFILRPWSQTCIMARAQKFARWSVALHCIQAPALHTSCSNLAHIAAYASHRRHHSHTCHRTQGRRMPPGQKCAPLAVSQIAAAKLEHHRVPAGYKVSHSATTRPDYTSFSIQAPSPSAAHPASGAASSHSTFPALQTRHGVLYTATVPNHQGAGPSLASAKPVCTRSAKSVCTRSSHNHIEY